MYDVIIVGARCSGAATALCLASRGLRVLAIDRARFPSDAIGGHCIWPRGLRKLQKWGILPQLQNSALPKITTCRMNFSGGVQLSACFPADAPVPFAMGPRRFTLDHLLVQAARRAGAEIREQCPMVGLLWRGDVVVGVHGQTRSGAVWRERASVVVGADGIHSRVARLVNAARYRTIPGMTCNFYTYWADVALPDLEMTVRPDLVVTSFPTNDGKVAISCIRPADAFHEFRGNIEQHYLHCLHRLPHLWQHLRSGRRMERFRGVGPAASYFRRSFGPGWALVGDAGYYKDPVTGSGISDAFRDAEDLADSIADGLCSSRPLNSYLAAYERRRSRHSLAHYWLTYLASTMDARELELLVRSAFHKNSRDENDLLLRIFTGETPLYRYILNLRLPRLLGLRGSMLFIKETYQSIKCLRT